MITEKIASTKPVVATGRELVLVVTESGQQIWVNKAQFDEKAELINYEHHKAGSAWTNAKTGETGTRKSDSNEFVGCKRASKFDVLDYLQKQGVTPTFSLS